MLSSVIYFSATGEGVGTSEILITLFLVITAPVSANILAKAAMHIGVRTVENTKGKPWEQ